MDGRAEGSLTAMYCASYETGKELIKRGQVVAAIDILTEDALLEIFDFLSYSRGYNEWHALVHVCRRWRNIVFSSSRYLGLLLLCTPTTPVRVSLHIWPPLPIIITGEHYSTSGLDNVIAALEHNDRICEVTLQDLSFSQLEEVVTKMQQPFRELTHPELRTDSEYSEYSDVVSALPDSFLGRSAPSLYMLKLFGIPFPALPKLLSSTPDLETLSLCHIPDSGYISPNTMLICLSALTCLEELWIEFYSKRTRLYCHSASPCPRRRTRTFLPLLRRLGFTGSSKYVEDLLNWLDAPLLGRGCINLFEEPTYDTPQLARFISCTPMFEAPIEAHVFIEDCAMRVVIPSSKRAVDSEAITVQIYCPVPDRQLWWLAQVCSSALPCLSTVEHLYISEGGEPPLHWPDNVENTRWWDLLRPYTALKNLYLSKAFSPRIAPALQELCRESVTEVLPKLQNIFLEDFHPSEPVTTAICQLVTGSHVDCYPIAVAHWDRELCTWKEDDDC